MTISKLLNSTDVHTVQRKVNEIIDEINTNVVFRNVEISRDGSYYCKTYDEYDSVTGDFIGKWCEQGCYCDSSHNGSGYTIINFVRSFETKNYSFTVTPLYRTMPGSDSKTFEVYSDREFDKTKIYSNAEAYGYSWKAEGYIADRVDLMVKETVFSASADLEFLTSDDESFKVIRQL